MARRAGRHELVDRGAALTYYGVLSLVPGLLVLFSVIGLFGNQETVDSVLDIVQDVGPVQRRGRRPGSRSTHAAQERHPVRSAARHRADRDPLDRLGLRRLLLPGVGDDLGSRATTGLARLAARAWR